MILKRPCSETYKKQWFFWSLLFRNTKKTMFFLVFLVSGRLFGSRREGQEFLKNRKTRKTIVFKVFLKSSDQKNQKTHCFLYDSVDAMLRIIQTIIPFLDVWPLTSRNIFGSRREEDEFPKYQKKQKQLFVCMINAPRFIYCLSARSQSPVLCSFII